MTNLKAGERKPEDIGDDEILPALAEAFCRFALASWFSVSDLKASLAAENLFLRKQLAFYKERRIRPRRTSHPARLTLLWLSRWFNWRSALTVVTPKTFIGWHRKGFQLFWRRKCQSGRPRIPPDLQRLIRKIAGENPSWGEERIANELLLKLGLRVSPRTDPEVSAQSRRPCQPVTLAAISVGQPFSRITLMPSSPVTSAL